MNCIIIGIDIFKCDHTEATEGGLRQRLYDYLDLQQTVDRGGSIYTRSLLDPMSLGQSDYLVENLTDPIGFFQTVVQSRNLPLNLTDPISFIQSATLAGGRVEATPSAVTATFTSNTFKGMPVYVSGDNTVDLASAGSNYLAIGLANDDVFASTLGVYLTDGQITRSDWTPVVGSSALITGATYYLSLTTGRLTNTPPVTGSIIRIGTALSDTEIDLEISQPVLL